MKGQNSMKRYEVQIKKIVDESYSIDIGYDLIDRLIGDLKAKMIPKVFKYAIITDENVKILYANLLENKMIEAGFNVKVFSIPSGEKYKTREMKAKIEDEMLEAGYRKDSCIIAMGGGVVTDLAGFLAATFCRGIPFINYATTFLAAADAAIGGKTAVDTSKATNMIGLIIQPQKVYIDLKTWETLPNKEIQNGLAETIKHACIADYEFFEFLESNICTIKECNRNIVEQQKYLEYICEKNLEIKYNVVVKDEHEQGLREILNLGHTLGRAIEAASEYKLSHGMAVSIGMAAETYLAHKQGMLSMDEMKRVVDLYKKAGLPVKINKQIIKNNIFDKIQADKKVRKGEVRFVLQEGIGKIRQFGENEYSKPIDIELIDEVIEFLYE